MMFCGFWVLGTCPWYTKPPVPLLCAFCIPGMFPSWRGTQRCWEAEWRPSTLLSTEVYWPDAAQRTPQTWRSWATAWSGEKRQVVDAPVKFWYNPCTIHAFMQIFSHSLWSYSVQYFYGTRLRPHVRDKDVHTEIEGLFHILMAK